MDRQDKPGLAQDFLDMHLASPAAASNIPEEDELVSTLPQLKEESEIREHESLF